MRAWLLVIAVLATFQPIVQVASTESTLLASISSSARRNTKTTNAASPSSAALSSTQSSPSSSSSQLPSSSTQSSAPISLSDADLNSVSDTRSSSNNMNNLNRNSVENSGKNSDEQIDRLDKATQVQIENNLLSLFGFKSRPKLIDRSKIVIPEAMKQLYAEIMGHELRESVNLPKPGLHSKSANTVRSFTHEGKPVLYLLFIISIFSRLSLSFYLCFFFL